MSVLRMTIPALSILLFATVTVYAQPAATQPAADTDATTQPAEAPPVDEVYQARVIEAVRSVTVQFMDENGQVGEKRPLEVGESLPPGAILRTGLRSRVVLAFGEDTAVVVEQLTVASIDQFFRSGETKVTRLGLGHGAIRAGVAETTLRSDMTIVTPTATLSKKGTMDFGIQYEPSTGRFRIYLDREGLVEALNRMTGESQTVHPGQYVTDIMQKWIDTALDDRWVPVVDTMGLTGAEEMFARLHETGLGVLEPTGSGMILVFRGDGSRLAPIWQAFRSQISGLPGVLPPLFIPPRGPDVIIRNEGNFGTGRGPATDAARAIIRSGLRR